MTRVPHERPTVTKGFAKEVRQIARATEALLSFPVQQPVLKRGSQRETLMEVALRVRAHACKLRDRCADKHGEEPVVRRKRKEHTIGTDDYLQATLGYAAPVRKGVTHERRSGVVCRRL